MDVWIIVAAARDGAIGRGGIMPWRLGDDLRRFKAATTGHAVIMGRRTWDSLGGQPLPNRHNVVVSKTLKPSDTKADWIAPTLIEALQHCQQLGYEKVYIMGGGMLYEAGLPYATHLNLTLVDTEVPDADTYLPPIDLREWETMERALYPADERNDYAVTQTLYRRLRRCKTL